MPRTRTALALLLTSGVATLALAADPPKPVEPPKAAPAADTTKLAITNLAPAKLSPNLCVYRYPISTKSSECQAFFDEGLGYFYSYVWMEAARCFETATRHDPDCAMAWWGLSRALQRYGRGDANKALQKASELSPKASYREQQLILARMQETGLAPNVGDAEQRKQKAIQTLDGLLAVHDEDEEAWYARAQLGGGAGLFGGQAGSVPFYKALLRINPLHPGANHELVHYYENAQRPALGWVYSENYIKSSPGIPHPWHMQSHLATRLGRWEKSSGSSSRAIELQKAYHKEMNVKPSEDHQYSHHVEVLMGSLIHDGRFIEARRIKEEMLAINVRQNGPWFRLHLAERDYVEAMKLAEGRRRTDKVEASYQAALIYLDQDKLWHATQEVNVLEEAFATKKTDRTLELRLLETRGRLLCQSGWAEPGLKLLAQAVEKTKNDYRHHAWGNGAYYMEAWGLSALRCGKTEVAEEAFLEALAHDFGSVRAALGLHVLCDLQGRDEESRRYAELARKFWKHAPSKVLDAEFAQVRRLGTMPTATAPNAPATPETPP